jgi:hypothetical protein
MGFCSSQGMGKDDESQVIPKRSSNRCGMLIGATFVTCELSGDISTFWCGRTNHLGSGLEG